MPSKTKRLREERRSETPPEKGKNQKSKAKDKGGEKVKDNAKDKAEPSKIAGRLIAIEGTRGPDLTEAAAEVVKRLSKAKVSSGASRWDASNTFYEMKLGKSKNLKVSPRVLLLLYATDLVFRLKWEIQPAIEQGMTVVAAPYVETGIAFGRAAGLPRKWLTDLFSFAPKASACYRVKEKKKKEAWKAKSTDGFLEFAGAALVASSAGWDAAGLRSRIIEQLDELEAAKGCKKLGKKI
ncbi:MAG: hypothetical protein EXQ52_14240 [Bryobacterales bacterium]|nr:hypothetical protein [Bryobacterales bacterium]